MPRVEVTFSSTVSDVHFGHFSHALHPGIESATTFSCHTL